MSAAARLTPAGPSAARRLLRRLRGWAAARLRGRPPEVPVDEVMRRMQAKLDATARAARSHPPTGAGER